ncbi:MAG: hypothetical protein APR63_08805 [Desulfuromonas sp. SDB]|nr:MAG: hypothetical protein APR63_08805 [Desulfuromonas sp. SDB]
MKIKFLTIICLYPILIFSGIPFVSESQTTGYMYISGGFKSLDLKEINQRLEIYNYPQFSDKFYSISIGDQIIYRRLSLNTEAGSVLVKNSSSDNYSAYISADWLYLKGELGYILFKQKNCHIYPFIGMGGAQINLSIVDHLDSDFNSNLDDPHKMIRFSTRCLVLNVGWGLDYYLKLINIGGEDKGIILGLKAGYNYTPYQMSWTVENINIDHGPKTGFNGPYIELIIGGGEL